MSFNWQTFRTRTLTAAIFVAVMLTGLLWNQWSFLVLFSIIHFGCWWEYLQLVERVHKTTFHTYTKLGLMVIGYGLMIRFFSAPFEIKGYGLKENLSLPISGAGFAVLLIGIFQKNPIQLRSFGAAALGLLYISLPWGFMMDLYSMKKFHIEDTVYLLAPATIPIVVIASIWVNDTMAYIVGSLIGRTPLSKISPKKTWEGTVGGIVLCIAVVSLLLPPILRIHDFTFWIFLAIISTVAAITGTFGDLLQSKLKRMADVKDSGSLMPGHGGFLDRFDSLLLAIPSVWILLYLLH